MTYAITYLVALVLFAAIDISWLMTMGSKLYRQTLGDVLLTELRIAPAAAFYLMYPAGLVIFAVIPALKSGSPATALLLGALLGLFAYGTYELTNFATIRNWTLQITLIDIAYGIVASGVVAAIVAMVVPYVAGAADSQPAGLRR
ncbi:MAG: DUF2177 family protein [Hyphomicrobium sp.]